MSITLAWQDALPHDDLQAVQAAGQKIPIGVSKTTLQRELGYDPEEELELSQTEQEQKVEQQLKEQQAMMAAQGVQPGQSPFMVRGQ